jgi:hypothetical protein
VTSTVTSTPTAPVLGRRPGPSWLWLLALGLTAVLGWRRRVIRTE